MDAESINNAKAVASTFPSVAAFAPALAAFAPAIVAFATAPVAASSECSLSLVSVLDAYLRIDNDDVVVATTKSLRHKFYDS